jgi:hypothetical protein
VRHRRIVTQRVAPLDAVEEGTESLVVPHLVMLIVGDHRIMTYRGRRGHVRRSIEVGGGDDLRIGRPRVGSLTDAAYRGTAHGARLGTAGGAAASGPQRVGEVRRREGRKCGVGAITATTTTDQVPHHEYAEAGTSAQSNTPPPPGALLLMRLWGRQLLGLTLLRLLPRLARQRHHSTTLLAAPSPPG